MGLFDALDISGSALSAERLRMDVTSENLANEFYTNVNGAHLHLIGNYHLTVDANGNITATRPFVWQCIGG